MKAYLRGRPRHALLARHEGAAEGDAARRDRPAIQYVVEEGLASDADEVVIINSCEKKAIEEHFPRRNLESGAVARPRQGCHADPAEQVGDCQRATVYQDEALGLGMRCAAGEDGRRAVLRAFGRRAGARQPDAAAHAGGVRQHGGASVIAVMPVPMTR